MYLLTPVSYPAIPFYLALDFPLSNPWRLFVLYFQEFYSPFNSRLSKTSHQFPVIESVRY